MSAKKPAPLPPPHSPLMTPAELDAVMGPKVLTPPDRMRRGR